MKHSTLLLLLSLFLSQNLSFSCEQTHSLERKMKDSSLVAIGTIVDIEFGEINKDKKSQHVTLKFSINETIYGKEKGQIIINCNSRQYSIENDDGSSTTYFSTAGFSTFQLEKGSSHIAYLQKREGKYYLSYSTNQCLEKIDVKKEKVTDIGQTAKQVLLKEKLKELRRFANEKEKSPLDLPTLRSKLMYSQIHKLNKE